jgi:hypothetical protein
MTYPASVLAGQGMKYRLFQVDPVEIRDRGQPDLSVPIGPLECDGNEENREIDKRFY